MEATKLSGYQIEKAYIKIKEAEHLSDYGIYRIHHRLKHILNQAVQDGIITRNPCMAIDGRDPFNQPESVNAEFIPTANKAITEGKTRIFSSSNVLNVICAAEFRTAYLETIADVMRPGEKVYITVYEGDRTGNAGPSGEDSWQENRKYKTYIPEIAPHFSDVTTKYGMIIATK